MNGTGFLVAWHTVAHAVLRGVAEQCGLHMSGDPLVLDLAIIRLVEPTSKLRSFELLRTISGTLCTAFVLPQVAPDGPVEGA